MNNREKAKALEDVLEFALRTDAESSHRHGLCGYVSYAADKGIITDEDKEAVYGLIRDLMNSVKQSIQSKHYNSDFSFSYLTEALHIKHDIPLDDHKRMQKVWVEEYRDFIAQLRQSGKPHLHGIKPGDRVWSVIHGWGTASLHDQWHLIKVRFDAGPVYSFTYCGRFFRSDMNPTIYWDEIQFEAPERPRPKLPHLAVDTPVLVRDSGDNEKWYPRHFHSFDKDGRIHAWANGCTQHTAHTEDYHGAWDEWKLPDEE
jgi:hypothetical protein